jgi:hypothetical protein
MNRMNICFLCISLSISLIWTSCHQDQPASDYPSPTLVNPNQEEGENSKAREAWEALIHRTAPGIDWQEMDASTRRILRKERSKQREQGISRTNETFANGNLSGTWSERGSHNQAGNLVIVDYDPDTDHIYGISAGGIVWRGNLNGTGWTSLNDDIQFSTNVLQVIPNASGGKRILAAIGKNIWYSDNNGSTWTQSTLDVSFYDNWGSARNLVALDDTGNSLYYLVHTWDATPWASRMWVYYSSDRGNSFNRIGVLGPLSGSGGVGSSQSSLWCPLEGTEAFLLHQGEELYRLANGNLTLLNTNSTLPAQTWLDLDGFQGSSTTTLYALMNKSNLYKSTDLGANWTYVDDLSVNSWNVGIGVSADNPDILFFGEVECYRTNNGGNSWSRVTKWWRYYTYPDSLHADIMDLKSFKKTDGTPFTLIANHGGLHVSYNNLIHTANIGLQGLNISQYYDVRTDPLNDSYIYGGTQDQGFQKTTLGNAPGPVNFDQVISGDYGHFAFSQNDQSLWKVYPFGSISYYNNAQASSGTANFSIPGSHPPVADWIYPTSETADPADNTIYVAGGNLNSGSGSYLIELTAATSAPYSITGNQISYNFRSNSNTGTSPISAIEPDWIDNNRLYVATDDGTFFYSNDLGASWNISSLGNGPGEYWLYGSCILSSRVTPNKVIFAGSGYSNPPVFVSTDGGQTFTSMSNGLPNTLVHEIVGNADETLYFAATEVGPFVYDVAAGQWFSMMGIAAPIQRYYSVEYIETQDVVRFGTYGRGIWDFKIVSQPVPAELTAFEARLNNDQQVELRWETASESQTDHFAVQRSLDGTNFVEIARVPAAGYSTTLQNYQALDTRPLEGVNYYRLQIVDADGSFEYAPIRTIRLEETPDPIAIFPNPIPGNGILQVDGTAAGTIYELYDASGRLIQSGNIGSNAQVALGNLPSGVYFCILRSGQRGTVLFNQQLIIEN